MRSLARAADRWKECLATEAGSPCVAVLVGGETRKYRLGPSEARQMALKALALTRSLGGQLWVTTSPRTGAAATEALARALGDGREVLPVATRAWRRPIWAFWPRRIY